MVPAPLRRQIGTIVNATASTSSRPKATATNGAGNTVVPTAPKATTDTHM